MLRFLRRTFRRKDDKRKRNFRKPPALPTGQHIPAPAKCRDFIPCHVILLDGSEILVDVPRKEKGEYLFRKIVIALDLIEEDYFGLQFMDKHQVAHWLDKTKKIKKQITITPPTFHFRVKFYTSEPAILNEELTRYQFFLQLKQDILSDKLPCSQEKAVTLASLALQSELGGFDPDVHNLFFLSEFRFIPKQDEEFEVAVLEAYKNLDKNMTPADAEKRYLEEAMYLEHYGVDMHSVKSKTDGNEYRLGLTPSGVLVLEGDQKMGLFFWPNILKLDFKERKLVLEVTDGDTEDNTEPTKHKFVFLLDNSKACKHLWKCAVEHHTFFRLNNPVNVADQKKTFIRVGSRFRPSFRTEVQLRRGASERRSIPFERKPSRRYSRRSSFSNSVRRVQVSGGGPDDHFRRFIPAEGPAAAPSRPNNPIGGLRMARPTRDPSDSSRSNEGRGNSLEGGKVGEARRPVLFIEKL